MKNIFWGTFEDFKIIQQTGCQAVTLQNGLSIWFWGTIYNTDLWRSEFKGDYPSFVLNLFSREGPAFFAKMDGSFTFIIRTPEEIMICRDHHGTGLPFFYSHNYFASSLQQFVQNKNFHAEPNHQALAVFLTRGYIPVPETDS